jgi:hypothetical protein
MRRSARLKSPGGISAHGLSGFEPEPFGLSAEVTVNFTIPGTSRLKRNLYVIMIYAGPASRESEYPGCSFTAKRNRFSDECDWIETT